MGLYFKDEDIISLKESVTPMQAIEFLGLNYKKKGSSYSILCPSPDHNDKKYGNCMVTKGGRVCKCYACNKSFSSLSILIDAGGYSFYDAMCILAQLSGRDGEFESSKSDDERKKATIKKLTPAQKKLLGFAEHSKIQMIRNTTLDKENSEVRGRDEGSGEYLICESTKSPWIEIAKEEPEVMDWMVRNKAIESIIRLQLRKDQLMNNKRNILVNHVYTYMNKQEDDFSEDIIHGINREINELFDIYQEFGGKLEKEKDFAFSHLANVCYFSP